MAQTQAYIMILIQYLVEGNIALKGLVYSLSSTSSHKPTSKFIALKKPYLNR